MKPLHEFVNTSWWPEHVAYENAWLYKGQLATEKEILPIVQNALINYLVLYHQMCYMVRNEAGHIIHMVIAKSGTSWRGDTAIYVLLGAFENDMAY